MEKTTKQNLIKLVVRIAYILTGFVGVVVCLMRTDGAGLGIVSLNFFTIQSNIWVVILGVLLAVVVVRAMCFKKEVKDVESLNIIKFAITSSILVTFLVYNLVLLPGALGVEGYNFFALENLLLHEVTPLLVLFDFMFFDRCKDFKWNYAYVACILPIFYFFFALVRAEFGGSLLPGFGGESRYPYFFLDLDKYGWFGSSQGMGVIFWVLIIVAGVIGLGYLLVYLKRATSVFQNSKINAIGAAPITQRSDFAKEDEKDKKQVTLTNGNDSTEENVKDSKNLKPKNVKEKTIKSNQPAKAQNVVAKADVATKKSVPTKEAKTATENSSMQKSETKSAKAVQKNNSKGTAKIAKTK